MQASSFIATVVIVFQLCGLGWGVWSLLES